MTETVEVIIAVTTALVAIIFWFARLESSTRSNKDDISRVESNARLEINKLEVAHQSLENAINMKFESLQGGLNQIIGSVGELKGELRGIKRG